MVALTRIKAASTDDKLLNVEKTKRFGNDRHHCSL